MKSSLMVMAISNCQNKLIKVTKKTGQCISLLRETILHIEQGCSHAFNIGGAQASKIILGPFCLQYWGAQTLLLL